MGLKIFIDTDIIIDLLIDRPPFAESANEIFERADQKKLQLYTSSLCINNVHYIVRKVVGEKKARNIIAELLDLTHIIPVTETELRKVLQSSITDFEDAIQYFAALKEKGIRAIITRNTKDFKKAALPVFHSDTFLKMLENEEL